MLILVAISKSCFGTTYTANSVALSDVQSAGNNCVDGDILVIPAGSATWMTNFYSAYHITVTGAGIGQTIITESVPRANFHDGALFDFQLASNSVECQVINLQIQGGLVGVANEEGNEAAISFFGYSGQIHVANIFFQNVDCSAIRFNEGTYGCVDDCQFVETNYDIDQIYGENGALGGTAGNSQGFGDEMWATPPYYGTTTNWIYIERCHFWCSQYWFINDGCEGTKMVFRYNVSTNLVIQNHGTESSQRFRSLRAWEIYDNYITNTLGGDEPIQSRGGTGVIFSNDFENFAGFITLNTFRGSENFVAWGGANGQNPWDTNGIIVATGTDTGANGDYFLTDSTKNWTFNQLVGGWGTNTDGAFEVVDVTQGGLAPQPLSQGYSSSTTIINFGTIASNFEHTVYAVQAVNAQHPINWTNGDTYVIIFVPRMIDMTGVGSGDLITDNAYGSGMPIDSVTGKTNWPNEVSEPLYQWGNTLNGVANAQIGGNTNFQNTPAALATAPIVIQGRDYLENTVKPGYAPLPFPHPLDTNGQSAVTALTPSGGYSAAFY
jgi:hypothetical protein